MENSVAEGPHGSSVERLMAALRDDIVRGHRPPGSRLIEVDIAEVFGISRTPVREAIRRLAGEGIVELVPNHGAWVREWDAAAVREVFELRELLEARAAELAAERATAADLRLLREHCERMEALEADTADTRWDRYAVLNHAFHRELVRVARSPRLDSIVLSLLGVPLLHRSFGGRQEQAMERSNRHHDDIVTAISLGEPGWARAAMAAHVHATRRLLLSAWERPPIEPEPDARQGAS